MSAQDNAQLAQEFYEALNKNDLAKAVALATEDVEIEFLAATGSRSAFGRSG